VNFQAIARNSSGIILSNTPIQVRVSVLDGSTGGPVLGSFTYQKTTDPYGQFTISIGTDATIANSGTPLNAINWTAASRFIKVEYLPGITGGFTLISNSEAKASFYAFAAKTSADGNPSGAIIAFGGVAAPSGWLLCNGSALSRTTYASLFAAIGTAYGAGNGSTTFNIPDFRGVFLRGVDGTAGNDPDKVTRTASGTGGNSGNNPGSNQSDNFKEHNHNPSNGGNFMYDNASTAPVSTNYNSTGSGILKKSTSTLNAGGNETRPINIYVNYIIKY
jgi:hypothetical protein